MNKCKEFPSIVGLMDIGLQKEIDLETEQWNKRENIERYPLSPSQIGKCALALGRNLSHYLGLSDYPRGNTSISPRVKRIFGRGHAIESLLIDDIEKYTDVRIVDRQKELTLFTLADGTPIKGSIDGIAVHSDGTRILLDFKSKGAFHSAGFGDSINQFFTELRQTGYVEETAPNTFYITDPKGLFDIISLDEFFVDYLLQLNAYGSAESVDFVSLYYENKNTCANYEVRWVPNADLFNYAKQKFQYIYSSLHTVHNNWGYAKNNSPVPTDEFDKELVKSVPKEFSLGSARCRLCEYNELCYGTYTPPVSRQVGELGARLDKALRDSRANGNIGNTRVDEEVLRLMEKEDYTHVQTSDGLTYERKFLKSPKPHHELRLSK